MRAKNIYFGLLILIFVGCKQNNNHNKENVSSNEANGDAEECSFKDGTYSATVDYHNPITSHKATYGLSVEVGNCEVTQIIFTMEGAM